MIESLDDFKRTKIVATIGPASWDKETIRQLIAAGMNVARINFSHGEQDRHAETIANVRQVAQEAQEVVGILCDIQGPKIRLGDIQGERVQITEGDQLVLTLDEVEGTREIVSLPHPEFLRDLHTGTHLLIDDGNIELEVEECRSSEVVTRVVIGGEISAHKGVTAPDAKLTLSAITDKDREDIEFALNHGADFIAMSFVRSADDVRELRWLMKHLGGDAAIVAKIEMRESLANIEEIIEVSDAIMVARGDLGVETPAEEVPFHQKRIIRLCNRAGKPVITATQMLESMKSNPRPTRAEANDVYNAILDGTDAVMLSAESATGLYPVRSVEVMARIAMNAERSLKESRRTSRNRAGDDESHVERISDAISLATFSIAADLNPKAIVTTTVSGYTTRRVAKERPHTPILCMTPNERVYRQMALVWGVLPFIVSDFNTIDEMVTVIVRTARDARLVSRGDTLIIIAGVPFGVTGQTNLLKVHHVGESGEI
jgi:pyruvate kinase